MEAFNLPPPPEAPKAVLRRHYRQLRRQSLPLAASALLEVLARERPLALEAADGAAGVEGGKATPSRLGLYWPLGHEPDWRPLLQRWPEALQRRLALPVVRPLAGEVRLTYAAWHPTEPLVADACGIPAPAAGEPLPAAELALLLVPALAVDRRGIRLGSGGGWYDRLRCDAAWGQVPALAVLPAACVAEALPLDPWDVPFAGWLDETGRQAKVSGFD